MPEKQFYTTDKKYNEIKDKSNNYNDINGDSLFKNINAYYRAKDRKRPIVREDHIKPIEDFEAKEWFTNTTDYEYINQLL